LFHHPALILASLSPSELTTTSIYPVDRAVLKSAFNSGLHDFEDAVQIFSAFAQGLEAIVTRDAQGFLSSPIPVLSVQELLGQVRQQNGG
jgi:hypothetical protein